METTNDAQNEKAFQLILHAGNSKSSSMEALALTRQGDYEASAEKFKDAQEEFNKAHEVQTALLFESVNGVSLQPDILLVHAQDHFTSAMVCLDLCQEMTMMMRQLNELSNSIRKEEKK